tara:strand:- start:4027 stop:5019 length:993 start_codon:yes stop_codon:yes gene_type:complete
MKINKIILYLSVYFILNLNVSYAQTFEQWKIDFKILAISKGISASTFDNVMRDAKFLPKVIEYDRYQPEFYEDTKTYISKRTSKKKVLTGLNYYKKNTKIINTIDQNFKIEKELLLALMGIETNFGSYLGKMNIISSLSTLSFDKRRSEFFTNELLTILKLIDNEIVDPNILYGSWAGAFGNFQFMPSTIEKYAIDYNNNNLIELKNNPDSFASAANYLNKMGWKRDAPCFKKVSLKSNVPKKILNTSARKIKNKKKIKYYKKYINDNLDYDDNLKIAIITPDVDIVDNAKNNDPAYIVFDNYELILKWNRSLRFGLAVCTLKDKFKNEL